MKELNWNKDVKIVILQRTIFNEVQSQLIDRDMSSTLTKFVILCQQINEDLCLNQVSQYRQSNIQQISWFADSTASNSSVLIHNSININVTCAQYASTELNEQKNCLMKDKCFDCNQKKHHYKNCSTNSYNKI